MNKADLINKVSEVLGSKKDAKAAVDCTIQTITEALSGNDSVKSGSQTLWARKIPGQYKSSSIHVKRRDCS